MIRAAIESALRDRLNELGVANCTFVLERPADLAHGDYACNAALVAAKQLGKSPAEIAQAISSSLAIEGVERVDIAGAGFINFFLSRDTFLQEIQLQDVARPYANNTFMVEYTDPNPFKEFHIGHLMSNAIGEAIARLCEKGGAEVIRANYQGDVGPHVAKCLFVLLEKNIADPTLSDISAAYIEGARRYEENESDKKAIDALNKTIYEKSDPQALAVYEKGKALTLAHFESLYALLGTTFNEYFFESETGPIGLRVVHEHRVLFEVSEGATVFRADTYNPKLHTRVFVTSQGLPTYEAKELGLVQLKKDRTSFDRSITITASEQNGFFEVVLEAVVHIFPQWRSQFEHRSHGMMRFSQGKMSSRLGNVITGESLLTDLCALSAEKMQERHVAQPERIAQQIAVGAIKYAVLKQGSGKNIVFDPEKSLSLEGDSGPYLQYAHTRAASLVREAKKAGLEAQQTDAPAHVLRIEKVLLHYPDALLRSIEELEPHYVTTYLTELAGEFNSWYASNRVIGGENPHYGVFIADRVEQILRDGLTILGIPVPEEM